jgi:N-acetylmuramoyl-L-alanine amidase
MMGFEVAVLCLSLNVFKEARGEPPIAQQAVALVTLNRAKAKDGDICKVVFEERQFSWTITDVRFGVLLPHKRPDRNTVEWKQAEASARQALYMKDFTGGATHYHEVKIHPYWCKKLQFVGRWGGHYFYKEKRK